MFDRSTYKLLKVVGGDWSFVGLPGADLRGVSVTGARLREADLTGARLEAATVTEVDLSGAWVQQADFTGCDLRGSDLSAFDPLTTTLAGAIITWEQASRARRPAWASTSAPSSPRRPASSHALADQVQATPDR